MYMWVSHQVFDDGERYSQLLFILWLAYFRKVTEVHDGCIFRYLSIIRGAVSLHHRLWRRCTPIHQLGAVLEGRSAVSIQYGRLSYIESSMNGWFNLSTYRSVEKSIIGRTSFCRYCRTWCWTWVWANKGDTSKAGYTTSENFCMTFTAT